MNPDPAVAASKGLTAFIEDLAMHGSTPLFMPRSSGPLRRLILCAAVVLAVLVWSTAKAPSANAQETKPPPSPALPALPTLPALPAAPADPAKPASAGDRSPTFEITIGAKADADAAKAEPVAPGANAPAKDAGPAARTVTVKKGGKTVTVTGLADDREYDSFGELMHQEPALAAMIVAIVAIVFLAPVLAIALIVGYRLRKARMQNDTMLKLAERGIVATPAGLAAVAGTPAAAAMAAPDTTAKDLRGRSAWSDLRKGVVMTAIGLALTAHSMLDDGTQNVVGLVLLFLGIGYGVLWWFEQRQLAAMTAAAGFRSGRGPGDAGNGT